MAKKKSTPRVGAIYARVSTTDQDAALQLNALRDHATKRDLANVVEYIDHGVSGAKDARPELTKLMQAVRRREVDLVLVWKFDRFARSCRHLVTALDEFRALGVDFVSVTEAVDTSTPIGRVMFTVIAGMAEFERELIRERVRAGIEKARAQGKRLGRPRLQVAPEQVAALRADGLSLREIALKLGISKSAAARLARAE